MKKKSIIIGVIITIIIIGIIGYIMWDNRTISVITLDINPSIKISLNKEEKVKKVTALNKDGKDVIDSNMKGKSLDDALQIITDNVVEKGYHNDGNLDILIYSTGEIDTNDLVDKIGNTFSNKEIHTNLIVIDEITKEDKKLAKKYNISPAKANYINNILLEHENIDVDNLVNRSVNELTETKVMGRYCDEDYKLEGESCVKEIGTEEPIVGMICPAGYYDYQGTCYKEGDGEETGKLLCREEFELNGEECHRTISFDADPVKFRCDVGEAKTLLELGMANPGDGVANQVKCVDYSSATHPVTPCELPADDPTERTFSGGRCYWHRAPVIETGCPGKIQVDGFCWDDATNIYICAGYRDGKQYSSKDEYCEHSIKYLDPVVTEYSCPEGHEVKGDKCIKEENEQPIHERTCQDGYKTVDYNRCINYNDKADKENGYICEQHDSRLKGNTCILYEVQNAKTDN